MARSLRKASAGNGDPSVRSDCRVEIELRDRGGVSIVLESKVESLYGSSIRNQVMRDAAALGLAHGVVRVVDQGALPHVISARVEAAFKRLNADSPRQALPDRLHPAGRDSKKDRVRRTRLYLPGNEPKFFPNASLHGPDCVILDLEDSVAPAEKDAARILVRNALRCVDFGSSERAVRINPGRAGLLDLRAVIPHGPQVVLIPKCESADSVEVIESEIRSLEKARKEGPETLLIPILESALGVVHAFAIASSSPRICALAIGLEDYTADIGIERTVEGKESLYARMAVITAAKAAGVQALDSVFSDVDDESALFLSTREAKALGFDGKGCIHPRQIGIIHSAFAPTAREIERARDIVSAAEEARKRGSGVISLGSKMIDAPVVKRAERILRLAEMNDAKEESHG
jgi:citrate lyase subunit beta / citryl-CoA lyase